MRFVVVFAILAALATPSILGAQSLAPPAASARHTWTLEDVIGAAITQHPLVDAASARLDAAAGARRTAGVFANPTATYWLEHGTTGQGPAGQALSGDLVRETQTYFSLPLEPLFQRGPRIRRADEEVKAASANIQTVRRRVALDAARIFFRVALAQVSVEAAQLNQAGLERLVSYNKARVDQGTIAEVELIRAQVELDRAAANVTLASVDLIRSRTELWTFLGFPQEVPAGFTVALPDAVATAALPGLSDYLARAREHRPEMVSARARAAGAAADVDYQRRLTVRQLGATAGFKRTQGTNSFLGGITVPLPLFDRNRGEVQRAAGDSLAAQKELTWLERQVSAEVEGAYGAAQAIAAQVGALHGAFVDRAAEADRITLAAYQQGAATLLQVLDTVRALADTRMISYRLILAQRQSVLDLALAAGEDPSAIRMPASIPPNGVTPSEAGDKR